MKIEISSTDFDTLKFYSRNLKAVERQLEGVKDITFWNDLMTIWWSHKFSIVVIVSRLKHEQYQNRNKISMGK